MDRNNLRLLREEEQQAIADARAIVDRAYADGRRDLTGEERTAFERADQERARLAGEIREYEEALEAAEHNPEYQRLLELVARDVPPPGAGRSMIETFLRGGGGPQCDVSFRNLTVTAPGGVVSLQTRDVYGYSGAGTSVVPTGVDSRLYQILTDVGAIWRLGPTVVQTVDGAPRKWPMATAYGTATITAEGGTLTEADPTLTTVTTTPVKYAWQLQLSNELIQDSAVDIVGFVATAAAQSLAKSYSADFAVGGGTGEPQGYVTGAPVGVTAAGTCTPESAMRLQMAVNQNYRTNGRFATNSGVLSYWRTLRDGAGGTLGAWLVQPPAAPGLPETLFGAPVIEDPGIPNHGSAVKSVVYGDFNNGYLMHQGGPLRFQRSDDYAFDRDLVTYRGVWRLDGRVRDTNALAAYQASA